MALLTHTVPASLRMPFEPSRFAQGLMGRSQRPTIIPTMISGPAARAAALSKHRFARLPHEPEDARMTGVTRSLHRRLLALNISGSLMRHDVLADSRIA